VRRPGPTDTLKYSYAISIFRPVFRVMVGGVHLRRDPVPKKLSGEKKGIDLQPIIKKVEKLKRPLWKPKVKEGDGPSDSSKFAGAFWLAEGEEWPVCPNCSKPMQPFLQLNLNTLPPELREEFGSGLLQLFYCISRKPFCEVDCAAYSPYSKSVVARIVVPKGAGRKTAVPAMEEVFPPRLIVGWEKSEEPPSIDEYELLGLELDEKTFTQVMDLIEKQKWALPAIGDKLGGWPFWMQGVEYPECKKCGETMRMVFQLDSENNLPYMFSDGGIGHITQCRKHKDVVAFNWASH
jgi:uncharacterized protein YwqG